MDSLTCIFRRVGQSKFVKRTSGSSCDRRTGHAQAAPKPRLARAGACAVPGPTGLIAASPGVIGDPEPRVLILGADPKGSAQPSRTEENSGAW
jgi:hypothetical protein